MLYYQPTARVSVSSSLCLSTQQDEKRCSVAMYEDNKLTPRELHNKS